MTGNPLLDHAGPKVNAISEDEARMVKKWINEVKMHMEDHYRV